MADFTLTSNRSIFDSALQSAIAAALTEAGIKAQAYAKKDCPVDTGNLMNSIDYDVETTSSGGTVSIGTNVEYAEYVEDGARGRAGKHFLKNAAQNHGDEYKSIIEKHLKNA